MYRNQYVVVGAVNTDLTCPSMCSDNRNLPSEANKAKCFVIACFVFSVFAMTGIAGGIPGIVGAICGILACVASSILLCCAPKSIEEGGGKCTAAGVLLLLAGVVQLIMAGAVIVYMIEALDEIDDNTYWFELYVDRVLVALGCSSQNNWDLCKKTHRLSKDIVIANDVVTGLVVILFGVAAFFLFIAGLLNTLGGAYCFKAMAAIQAKPIVSATGMASIAASVGWRPPGAMGDGVQSSTPVVHAEVVALVPHAVTSPDSIADEIAKLKSLRDAGVLTEDEFVQANQRALC